MKVDILEIMEAFLNVMSVQILYFTDTSKEGMEQVDYRFRQSLYEDFSYEMLTEQWFLLCQPGEVIHLEEDFGLHYIVFLMPDAFHEEYHLRYCLIGPVLFRTISSSFFYQVMERKNIPVRLHRDVFEFYHRIPVISSYEEWNYQMSIFYQRIMGSEYQIISKSMIDQKVLQDQQEEVISIKPQIAQTVLKERYQAEYQLLHAVTRGDVKKAMECHQKFLKYTIPQRLSDTIRERRNLMIVFNTLLRKCMEPAMVHPRYIDALSRQFAIKIESLSTNHDFDLLKEQMIRKYCILVKNHSRKQYSSLVQTCMDYIDFHYTQEISLDSMAQLSSVTPSYLSALFKKETGVTITEYMNTTRIRQALILLNTTSFSICEIATQCGFSSANYFTRTFKKYQGQSPREYKNLIRS